MKIIKLALLPLALATLAGSAVAQQPRNRLRINLRRSP